MKKSLTLSMTILVLFGCGANQLVVDSSPQGAEVFAVGENSISLGKTPLTVTSDDFFDKVKSSTVQLKVDKSEFSTAYVLLGDLNASEIRVHVKLEKEESFGVEEKNDLVEALFRTQKYIRLGMLKEAETEISKLKEGASDIAAVHELEGSVHVLRKNWVAALNSFERALAFNPSSDQSRKIAIQLAAKLNKKVDRLPAQAEPLEAAPPVETPDSQPVGGDASQ